MMTKYWLNDRNIAYEERSVDRQETAEELMNMGYRSTPVIMIDGTAIVGYNPIKLEEALA